MNTFENIKGFAFDLDGVIADTAKFHGQAWHALADKVGTTWTDELAENLKGVSRMDSLEMILKYGQLTDKYTMAEKEALAEEKNTFYKELISTLTEADILPGMKDFILSLKDNGYKLSVASASKNAPFILEKLGLIQYFDAIVDPATLSAGKPDPEIFAKAAEVIDLKANEVIGLEDSTAGIDSINGAGEISLAIGDKAQLNKATMVFANTAEVTLENIKAQLEK